MSFLSMIPIVGKFIDKGLDLIDKAVEDKDLANTLKSEFKKLQVESNLEMEKLDIEKQRIELEDDKSKRNLLKSVVERKSLPLAEIFYLYMLLIVFNYIFVPILISFGFEVPIIAMPEELSSIMNTIVFSFFTYKGTKKGIGVFEKKK